MQKIANPIPDERRGGVVIHFVKKIYSLFALTYSKQRLNSVSFH